jgi:regulator of protease activity HflC (stomatin/prohibitin superfamily)
MWLITFLTVIVIMTSFVLLRIGYGRYKGIRESLNEYNLFLGLIQYIFWYPNEGIVILRNKRINEIIMGNGGGTKLIFPIFGDEMFIRIPITMHLLNWQAVSLLTRESITVQVKIAMWWNVSDLYKYVFEIETDKQKMPSHVENLRTSSEAWIIALTESCLRNMISKLSVALLVSSKASNYLNVNIINGDTVENKEDIVFSDLGYEITTKASPFGIKIIRFELQDISLAEDIQDSINNVWKSFLLPIQTEQESSARQLELANLSKVLGVNTVSINEVLKNFQGSSFFSVPAFIESLFNKIIK